MLSNALNAQEQLLATSPNMASSTTTDCRTLARLTVFTCTEKSMDISCPMPTTVTNVLLQSLESDTIQFHNSL